MNRIAAVTAAIVLALTLTGCGEDTTAENTPPPSEPTPTESAPPLVAEQPEAPTSDEADAAFLTEVRARLERIHSQIPNASNAQLLTAAREACERINSGETSEGMTLIDGEKPSDSGYYMDSGTIITSARLTICPPVKE